MAVSGSAVMVRLWFNGGVLTTAVRVQRRVQFGFDGGVTTGGNAGQQQFRALKAATDCRQDEEDGKSDDGSRNR